MQWIQRLVVDNIRSNVIEIAPPIVSRVFQEFSLGIVNIAAAKKITIIPFPFPYAQMMQVMLLMQSFALPAIAGYAYHKWWVASGVTFSIVLLSWCVHFTACELEMPFGDDDNDLPLAEMVTSMNDSLVNLLIDRLKAVPLMHLAEAKWGEPLSAEDRVPWNPWQTGFTENTSTPLLPLPTKLPPDSAGVEVAVADHLNDLPRMPNIQPPPHAVEPPIASAASAAATPQPLHTEAALSGEVASRLMMLSSQIEGHLTQICKSLTFCSRMEERVDKISAEVSQIGTSAMMFMERMDRLDKANMIGRPSGEAEPSQLWFCAPGSGQAPAHHARPMAPTTAPRALPMSGASDYLNFSSEKR